MGVCNCSLFCCAVLYVHSSFAIILMVKRELVALLSLPSWCLAIVVRLFLAVPWVCLLKTKLQRTRHLIRVCTVKKLSYDNP